MNTFDNEIKKSIEEIKPDFYMKTRLAAKISEQTKPKKKKIWKKACAGVLALAVICASIGGYYTVQKRNTLDFAIVAYADDGTTCKLSDDDIKMPFGRVKKSYYEDVDTMLLNQKMTGFEIEGKNIDEVTFKSDNYKLQIHDKDMQENQESRNDYICVKIPLNDEEIIEFNAIEVFDPELTSKNFLKKMMENRDLSEYFGDNSMNIDDYHVSAFLDTSNDLLKKFDLEWKGYIYTYFYLVENDVYEDVDRYDYEITEKNYDEDDKISDVYLNILAATEYVMEHPDTKLSELPECNITVTVKFKSGETVEKQIHTEFDDYGYLHCKVTE